jgi:hypothetical protein
MSRARPRNEEPESLNLLCSSNCAASGVVAGGLDPGSAPSHRVVVSAPEERADDRPGEHELSRGGEAAGTVPAAPAVEDLATERPERSNDVLEVGGGRGDGTDRRGIETAIQREKQQACDTAGDLEPPARDVLMRHAIFQHVQEWTDQGCATA